MAYNTAFIEQVKYFHALGDRHHVCMKSGKPIYIYGVKWYTDWLAKWEAVLKTKQLYNIPLF